MDTDGVAIVDDSTKDKLVNFVRKIESLEHDKLQISCQISETYSNAKIQGLDVKALRKLISKRKIEESEREMLDEMISCYEFALSSK